MADDKPKQQREVRQETTLSSGRTVTVYKGKAQDLVKAQAMVQSPAEMQLGLASMLVQVDGQMLPVEDWREMDLEEYMEVLPLLMPGSAATQGGLLSPSPGSSAGATEN